METQAAQIRCSSECIELVNRAAKGERHAQLQLFEQCKPAVLAVVWSLLMPANQADIEDAIQQVYIQLFRSWSRFQAQCALSTWVGRIATRVCIGRIRHKYRKRTLPMLAGGDQFLQEHADTRADSQNATLTRELREQLYAALDTISPQRKAVFVLHEIQGWPLEEIANAVGSPLGTIKSRLSRAREDLRHLLAPYVAAE